jgi:hypothetical protein
VGIEPWAVELRDRQEIEGLITLYPRAIDRLDIELLKSIYHPDARDDHGPFKGTAYEFADFVVKYLREMFVATMHHVTHSHIEVAADRAAGESYYYAYHRLEGDFAKVASFFGRPYAEKCQQDQTLPNGHEFICGGRYLDCFVKSGGVWKIANREITVEWKHFRPVTVGAPDSGIETIVAPAGRDRSDIAYRTFAFVSGGHL